MTLYTPTSQFFRHRVRSQPDINPLYWSLWIAGQLDVPLSLSYSDLLARPAVTCPLTLACAGGTDLMSTALWQGILLRELLAEGGLKPAARFARFYAADGYVTSFALDQLDDALLVHHMNEQPLLPEHGFPLRLILPDRYGYKLPRWLQRIEIATTPALSMWEQRGWPTAGSVRPAILMHPPTATAGIQRLQGFAFTGAQAITQIQVSIDDAPWMPIAFEAADAGVWTPWSIDWQPPGPGSYAAIVRVIDSADRSAAARQIIMHA